MFPLIRRKNILLSNYSNTNTFSRPFVTTWTDNFQPVYVKNVYGQSDKTYTTRFTL